MKEQFDLLACGIAQIGRNGSQHPLEETVLRAQQTVEEHHRLGDITAPERGQLRYLIAEILRMRSAQGGS